MPSRSSGARDDPSAWDALRPGGTAIVVGLAPAVSRSSPPAIEFLSQKTITGSYYGSTNVDAALGRAGAARGRRPLDLGDVVQYLITLDDLEAALERLRRGHGARSVIVMDEQLAEWARDPRRPRRPSRRGLGRCARRRRQPRQCRARAAWDPTAAAILGTLTTPTPGHAPIVVVVGEDQPATSPCGRRRS